MGRPLRGRRLRRGTVPAASDEPHGARGAAAPPSARPPPRRARGESRANWASIGRRSRAAAAPAASASATCARRLASHTAATAFRQPDPQDDCGAHDGQSPLHRARDPHHHGGRFQSRQSPQPVQGGRAGETSRPRLHGFPREARRRRACKSIPLLAASWVGEEIVAASGAWTSALPSIRTPGLFVPVVRDVPSLSVRQVAAQTRDLAERARNGTLQSAEMQGGVFTITNLGAFGVDAFTPIINYPQCAILGVGRIQRRPVVVGDQFVIARSGHAEPDVRPSHRGRRPGRAVPANARRNMLENPGPWLMP